MRRDAEEKLIMWYPMLECFPIAAHVCARTSEPAAMRDDCTAPCAPAVECDGLAIRSLPNGSWALRSKAVFWTRHVHPWLQGEAFPRPRSTAELTVKMLALWAKSCSLQYAGNYRQCLGTDTSTYQCDKMDLPVFPQHYALEHRVMPLQVRTKTGEPDLVYGSAHNLMVTWALLKTTAMPAAHVPAKTTAQLLEALANWVGEAASFQGEKTRHRAGFQHFEHRASDYWDRCLGEQLRRVRHREYVTLGKMLRLSYRGYGEDETSVNGDAIPPTVYRAQAWWKRDTDGSAVFPQSYVSCLLQLHRREPTTAQVRHSIAIRLSGGETCPEWGTLRQEFPDAHSALLRTVFENARDGLQQEQWDAEDLSQRTQRLYEPGGVKAMEGSATTTHVAVDDAVEGSDSEREESNAHMTLASRSEMASTADAPPLSFTEIATMEHARREIDALTHPLPPPKDRTQETRCAARFAGLAAEP